MGDQLKTMVFLKLLFGARAASFPAGVKRRADPVL